MPLDETESKTVVEDLNVLSADECKEVFEAQTNLVNAQTQTRMAELNLQVMQMQAEKLAACQLNAVLKAANRRGISTDNYDLTQDGETLKFVAKPAV